MSIWSDKPVLLQPLAWALRSQTHSRKFKFKLHTYHHYHYKHNNCQMSLLWDADVNYYFSEFRNNSINSYSSQAHNILYKEWTTEPKMISEHTTVKSKLSTSTLCQISSSEPTFIFHRETSYDRLYWSRFHAQVTHALVIYAFILSWSSKVKGRTTHLNITTTFMYFIHLNTTYNFSNHLSETICSDKLKERCFIFCQSQFNYKISEGCFSVTPKFTHVFTTEHK